MPMELESVSAAQITGTVFSVYFMNTFDKEKCKNLVSIFKAFPGDILIR